MICRKALIMNKEQELTTQLAQAIKDRDAAFNLANTEIGTIHEQIAEEQKPKVNHGDYGRTKYDMKFIILNGN